MSSETKGTTWTQIRTNFWQHPKVSSLSITREEGDGVFTAWVDYTEECCDCADGDTPDYACQALREIMSYPNPDILNALSEPCILQNL